MFIVEIAWDMLYSQIQGILLIWQSLAPKMDEGAPTMEFDWYMM